jgi:hypothetical protein
MRAVALHVLVAENAMRGPDAIGEKRPGEVFVHGVRTGSSLDALLADACVVVSCLLQHGVEPRELAHSMGRLGNAEPASIIGAVVDLAAAAAVPTAQSTMEASQ